MKRTAEECRKEASVLAGEMVVKLGYLCGDTPGIKADVKWYENVMRLMRHASDFSMKSTH